LSKPFLALILAAAPLAAEFLHVEQSVTGLDCMSCAESAPRNLKKIKGVESASFRTSYSVAVLELKAGNTVPLGDIRDAVKRMGYTPQGAKIAVRGQVRSKEGKWILRVAGLDAEYRLDISTAKVATKDIDAALRQSDVVIVEGSLPDPNGPIQVSAVRRAE
jgi:cation transport ATPase